MQAIVNSELSIEGFKNVASQTHRGTEESREEIIKRYKEVRNS